MKIDDFIIDDMVFSHSRLSSFNQCKYMFYQQYITCGEGEDNFFGQYGKHSHEVLEKYARGDLEIFELVGEYTNTYDTNITYLAPPNRYVDLDISYHNAGLDYFNNFAGFDDYNIIDVEKHIKFYVGDVEMTGFIDLVLREDNLLALADHKSSDPKTATSKKAREYWRQLYLYSIPMEKEYGEYPSKLHLNCFRKGQWFTIDFNLEGVENAKKWVTDTVNLIRQEEEWKPTIDEFFCKYICNFRNTCKHRWGA